MRLTGRNLEALRSGIAEQERKRIEDERTAENIASLMARNYIHDDEIAILRAGVVMAGDVLVATDDGHTFWVAGVVRRIERTTEEGKKPAGDWWLTVDRANGGSYGRALKDTDPVLIRQADRD